MNYLDQVRALLKTLPDDLGPAIAAYNTGFGLSVCPDLGDGSVGTIDVVCARVLRIPVPSSEGDQWHDDWEGAKQIVNEFVKQYNLKAKG